MPRATPISLPPTESIEELRREVESALNRLVIQINRGDFTADVSANDHRIKNVGRPAAGGDAVNLEYLNEALQPLKHKLTRTRNIAYKPGYFKKFTARHFLQRPEERNALAEPAIELQICLPAQYNAGAGLQNADVLKRNTEYVVVHSDWDTLAAAADAVTTTFTMAHGNYFKPATLYRVDDEWLRVVSTSGNEVVVERGQENSTPGTHTSGATVQWIAKIPKEGFTPDENGVLGVNPIIDNSERVPTRVFVGVPYNSDGVAGGTSTYTLTLAPAPAISDMAASPQFGAVNLTWTEQLGSTYRYQIFKERNGFIAWTEAQFYDEVMALGTGEYIYPDPLPRPGDADPVIGTWGDNFTYGARAINILGSSAGGDTVGPLQGDSASEPVAASDVTDINASESPYIQPDGTVKSEVTVSFTKPSPLGSWKKVNIYMLRSGESTPKFITSFVNSPGKFLYDVLDETVTLYFVSASDRLENDVLSSPNTTVTLDGQTSPPTPVSNLAAQQVVDGIMLTWSENAETDLFGYEVADMGDLVPPTDGAIEDKHVIAEVPGVPQGTKKVQFIFKETLYTGTSDGTRVSIPSPVWIAGAHVMGTTTGKNVHFTLTTHNLQCVANGTNYIDFAPGAAPTGTVDFYIRGTDGAHHLYVRAVNNSGLKSEWRPIPPSVLVPSPLAPDGTEDMGIPNVRNISQSYPLVGHDASYFLHGNGRVQIHAVAVGTDTYNPKFINLQGVTGWGVKIVYIQDGTSTSTGSWAFGADQSGLEAWWGGVLTYYILVNNLPAIDLPNVDIYGVWLKVANYFGESDWTLIADPGGTSTISGVRYTGFTNPDLVEELTSNSPITLNLAKAHTFKIQMNSSVSSITVQNSAEGQTLKLIFVQDAIGGRTVTWPSNFKGVSNYEVDGTPNTFSSFIFHCDGSDFYLMAPPVTGAS